jgi:hypothetical protein
MHDSHEYPRFIAAIARSMLWFPVGKQLYRTLAIVIKTLNHDQQRTSFSCSHTW